LFFQEFLLLLSHKRPYSYRPDGEKKSQHFLVMHFLYTLLLSAPHVRTVSSVRSSGDLESCKNPLLAS
jgi:hypothetical protein